MRKSFFFFALILLFFPVCSLSASNFECNDGDEVNGRNLIIVLNTYIKYLKLLKKFANCLQNYNIFSFNPLLATINHRIEQAKYNAILIYSELDPQDCDPSLKTMYETKLEEQFERLIQIMLKCMHTSIDLELVDLLHDSLVIIHKYLYAQFKEKDWSGLINDRKERISNVLMDAFTTVCMASVQMLRNLIAIKQEKQESRRMAHQRKIALTKQLSGPELREAEKLANLNAHIAMGCCTDGSCDSLESTGKKKTKSKRSGRKKQKELAEKGVAEADDKVENKQSNLDIEYVVDILNLILEKLRNISGEESKLRILASSYNDIHSDIMRLKVQSSNDKLVCRADKLPENLPYNSNSSESKNNKSECRSILRKMAGAVVCGCTNDDCKIGHTWKIKDYCVHSCGPKFEKNYDVNSVD
ncbi:hypothetical protein OJ253_1811 [Cryptosporidium canis]|uniref:Signal peptide-containing protein n=1 Tax=Cryptosporidium canis TaxID=195482 RepID=A0A9D5HYS0_9CRYT|nr:hypothetical protein OJ253_1811 [Cryptosporidium canis]